MPIPVETLFDADLTGIPAGCVPPFDAIDLSGLTTVVGTALANLLSSGAGVRISFVAGIGRGSCRKALTFGDCSMIEVSCKARIATLSLGSGQRHETIFIHDGVDILAALVFRYDGTNVKVRALYDGNESGDGPTTIASGSIVDLTLRLQDTSFAASRATVLVNGSVEAEVTVPLIVSDVIPAAASLDVGYGSVSASPLGILHVLDIDVPNVVRRKRDLFGRRKSMRWQSWIKRLGSGIARYFK